MSSSAWLLTGQESRALPSTRIPLTQSRKRPRPGEITLAPLVPWAREQDDRARARTASLKVPGCSRHLRGYWHLGDTSGSGPMKNSKNHHVMRFSLALEAPFGPRGLDAAERR